MKKTQALIALTIGILLASTFTLAIDFASAKQSVMGQIQANMEQFSNRLTQASWVRMKGNVSEWGTTDVSGVIQVQARTAVHQSSGSNKVSSVTAMWTTNTSRAIDSYRAKENFTYVFHVARLTNSSLSTLSSDTSTNTYFLNGTWNLATVVSTITVNTDENGTITHVNRNQDITPTSTYGELSISDNQYTLTITDQDPLSGTIYRSITRSWFNPFKMSDDSTNNLVTHTDVKTIGHCYGAMPGWGNYDSSMDFNYNYRVDIADISTVAANI